MSLSTICKYTDVLKVRQTLDRILSRMTKDDITPNLAMGVVIQKSPFVGFDDVVNGKLTFVTCDHELPGLLITLCEAEFDDDLEMSISAMPDGDVYRHHVHIKKALTGEVLTGEEYAGVVMHVFMTAHMLTWDKYQSDIAEKKVVTWETFNRNLPTFLRHEQRVAYVTEVMKNGLTDHLGITWCYDNIAGDFHRE